MPATGNNTFNQHSLSIRLSADGFSFSMYIPSETSPERMYRSFVYHNETGLSLADNMRKAFTQVPFLGETADRVFVVVCSPVTEVPLDDFYPEDADTMYRYCYPDAANVQVLFNRLPSVGLSELFSIDRSEER